MSLARPKSVRRGMNSSGPEAPARITLSGLMSRWRMPRSWACWTASASAASPARRQPRRDRLVLGLQPAAQAGARAELRGDEVAERAELAGVVDPHDVGMVEPGRGPGLAEEPVDIARRQHALGQRHLQGHFAAQHQVLRADHETEPARPEVVEDLESAQQRPTSHAELAAPRSATLLPRPRPWPHSAASSIVSRSSSRLRPRSSASVERARRRVDPIPQRRRRAGAHRRPSSGPASVGRSASTRRARLIRGHGRASSIRAASRAPAHRASARRLPRRPARRRSPRTTIDPRSAGE